MTEKSYARSINLPNEQIFRNLNNARCLALDIGKCEHYIFCQSQQILLTLLQYYFYEELVNIYLI